MSKTPKAEEVKKNVTSEEAENAVAELLEEKKKTSGKKRSKSKKIPENETEEERKEREKKEEKKKKSKPKDIKQATKRLIGYISKYKPHLIVTAILVVMTSVITGVASMFMLPVYKAIERALDSEITKADATKEIAMWLVLMAAVYVLSSLLNFIYTRIMLYVSTRTIANLRRDLFNHLQSLPIGYFDKRKTGEIMSHFTNDANRIKDLVSSNFPTLISSSIQAVLNISIMIYLSGRLTATITFAIIAMFAVVFFITSKCSPLFKQQQKAIGECNGYIEEYIRGIKVVQLFSQEEKTKSEFRQLNENYRKTGVKANIIGGFMSPLMSIITRSNYAIVVLYGASLIRKGLMGVPELITYISYAKSYASPIASLASCYSSLVSALAGAERIFEVLDTSPETDEGRVALVRLIKDITGEAVESTTEEGDFFWKVPGEHDEGYEYVPVKGNINVNDITFAYVEGTDVLKNVTVSAASGQKVAFVGSTGAGKTTITNLINRFYEINRGEITYDGIPIKDIKKADLRRSMAIVLQDTRLFNGTIADNIRYGKLDATDEEVIAAAKLANAHSFIEKLPDGYETVLKADAANLSVGQAQLINIARAAISKTPLLILDEATSSVDTRTERLIEIGMDKLMENRTVFVIAHRLSTVRNSDRIVVLENGEIIEEGNHEELIAREGKYHQLYTGAFEMN